MNSKQVAGEYAAKYVSNNMIVGLGTGSTIYYTILEVGKRVRSGLKIQAVATSVQTEQLAKAQAIPLLKLDDVSTIDLTIDGADEVDAQLRGVKGGGGALFREKMVALTAKQNIWVLGQNKLVNKLGQFPLPIEVVPFGSKHTAQSLAKFGAKVIPRKRVDGELFVTDNQNYIFDLYFEGGINQPEVLESELRALTGVVETGLFLGIANKIVIGSETGKVEVKTARS